MDGNAIFQTLTAFILALFSAVFLLVFIYDRTQKFAGWLAVAYTCGLITFFLDVRTGMPTLAEVLTTNTAFWGTSMGILAAASARAGKPFPLKNVIFLLITGYGTNLWFSLVMPDVMWRTSMTNMVAGLVIGLGIPVLYSQRKRKIDRAVLFVIGLIAFTWCIRPILAFGVFGAANDYSAYSTSIYAFILHLTSAISALAGAVIMLLAAGLDMTDRLHRVSMTDYLTDLRNRRGLDELFSELKEADELTGRALIALDLDGFKQINDDCGHDAGDAVLKRLGSNLPTLLDKVGTVARIGGEEFLILLNASCSPAAMHFAEQIRSAVAMINHPELAGNKSVTASFGVAVVRDGETSRSALRRADIALYSAKSAGRNCVKAAEEISLETRAG